MRVPNKFHLAAKAFFRDLLDACGGPRRAMALTGHPDSHLSAMAASHASDRWPRIDHVIDLEQECGQPIVTRYLADLHGFDLVPRDQVSSDSAATLFLRLVKECGDVQIRMAEAMADGRLDAADRLGRNCIGIELNPEYAAMARRRIEGDAPLFAEVSA